VIERHITLTDKARSKLIRRAKVAGLDLSSPRNGQIPGLFWCQDFIEHNPDEPDAHTGPIYMFSIISRTHCEEDVNWLLVELSGGEMFALYMHPAIADAVQITIDLDLDGRYVVRKS
jgi:hypothetical protein